MRARGWKPRGCHHSLGIWAWGHVWQPGGTEGLAWAGVRRDPLPSPALWELPGVPYKGGVHRGVGQD